MTTTASTTAEHNKLPYVAVTMGDGAGVGPEVVGAQACPITARGAQPVSPLGDRWRVTDSMPG